MKPAIFLSASVAPIPTAFPELGELSEIGAWCPWWVYYTLKGENGAISVAQFHDPLDAFAFAEEKQRREGPAPVRMYDVRLAWELTNEAARKAKRCKFIFVETLPASWLREQRKAAERAQRLRKERA
jgi:hypothetical protein